MKKCCNTIFQKFKPLIFCFLSLQTFLSFSQQYNFRTYSIDKGLPKASIYCMIQDSRGYLWMGTDGGGACRFDGKKFVSFTKRNGLAGNVVRTIIEDSKGNLWFGSDAGISVYNGYTFFNIDAGKGFPENPVLKIFEDSGHNIWAGTSGSGLCKIKIINKDSVFVKIYNKENDRIQTNYVFDITEDNHHNYWLGLYGGVNILTFRGDSLVKLKKLDQAYGEIPSNIIFSVRKDKQGDIWFGTQDAGAFRIAQSGKDSGKVFTFSPADGLGDYTVWSIMEDSKNNLWFSTNKGGITKKTSDGIIHLTQQNGLAGNQVMNVCEDKEGNFWAGTYGNGICQFIGENFIHFTEKDGLPNRHVLSVIQDKSGNFWLATDGGGLSQLSFKGGKPCFRTFTTDNGLPDNIVNCVSQAKDGSIWIATESGVSRYFRGGFKNYTQDDCITFKNRVNCVYSDSKGLVWFGTNFGMCRFDGKKFIPWDEKDDKYALFNNIICITEDKKGNIWYGTYGGLLKNDQEHFIFYDEAEGLKNKKINCLAEDAGGNIWIGSFEGGLYKFDVSSKDNQPISLILNDSLLSSDNIYSLIFQDQNVLIVGTDKGFDKVVINNSGNVIRVMNYNETDGFTAVENHINSICKDDKGNIWFGTIQGVTKYNPSLDNTNLEAPVTHLTNINLFFENIDWLKKTDTITPWFHLPLGLDLSYKENHFTFKFTGISLSNPDRVLYKYMLEGLDKTWSPARKEGEAVYPGLAPGNYIFKVMAANKYGKWNENPIKFAITIRPPFWKTTWFYFCVIVFIVLGFYLFTVIRVRKLKKDKQVLEQKVRERTAEIERQKKEIEEKNEELHQSNEEITAQRDQIQEQKHLVEEQHKEITDSIRYARRIQSAVQPTNDYIDGILCDYFIFYRPKDIVSGDFYWLTKRKNLIIIVAADCTGHGVPGAFMSMLGISFLNEIVSKDYIKHSNQVLDELRQYIVHSLQQKGITGEQKDGMDIVFTVLDTTAMTLEYSGANNPLYHIRENEFSEYKADKMPIAIYEDMKPFSCTVIQLQKGDSFYMASDGYEDQFGGPKGKKFMSKQLKELLKSNSHLPMKEQKIIVEKAHDTWVGYIDQATNAPFLQVDDVLVIGVKV